MNKFDDMMAYLKGSLRKQGEAGPARSQRSKWLFLSEDRL